MTRRVSCWFHLMLLLLAVGADAAPKEVLVVTVTTGFRHSCIPVSERVLEELARADGRLKLTFVRQPAPTRALPPRPPRGDAPGQMEALQRWQAEEKAWKAEQLPAITAELARITPENLRHFDAVVFANTTGDLPLPDKQGFVDWVHGGGAFVGIHAAADTFHGFPKFIAMLGGEFLKHGPQVEVKCLNRDPAHAATAHLPATWTVFDEIYQFRNYDPTKVRDLLVLDRHPNDGTPGHFPVAWCRSYGAGRVFYTSLGHREDLWDPGHDDGQRKNPAAVSRQYQRHILQGLIWAVGLEPGSSTVPGADR